MTETITIANYKGGIGKTTSVWNIAAALSLMDKHVLLVDLDGQRNLSQALLKNKYRESIYDLLSRNN